MAQGFDPLLPRAGPGHRPATGGWRSALFIICKPDATISPSYLSFPRLDLLITGANKRFPRPGTRSRGGGGGAVRVLRHLLQPHQLPDRPARGEHGRRRQRLVRRRVHAAAARRRRRRLVARPLPHHRRLLPALHHGPRDAGAVVHVLVASEPRMQACPRSSLQTAFFYVSLYLVAIAQSGHKPCVQAFGADQFDATDPTESLSRGSFFNWWYFGICGSATVTIALMSYVQDNVSWGIGFGVPCIVMVLALVVFLLGTKTYRFYDDKGAGASSRVAEAFWASRKRSTEGVCSLVEHGQGESAENAVVVEEVRSMARLFPIWATCLLYGVVFAQPQTLFTKQAATLDRRVGSSGFQIPPAALQCFMGISMITCVVMYDRVLVPVARRVSGAALGITMLQRIGTGMALAVAALVAAALVEMRRLSAAVDAGVVDQPDAVVPMSLWWIMPQYVLLGAADVFTMVGMQEFFYDQMPGALKSLGLALYLSVLGVGSFISSFLISVIDGVTRRGGGTSWFADNLNRAHLDYFYLLLAALTALELLAFLCFSASYVYRRKAGNVH